jgi:hypothetical protein
MCSRIEWVGNLQQEIEANLFGKKVDLAGAQSAPSNIDDSREILPQATKRRPRIELLLPQSFRAVARLVHDTIQESSEYD